MTDKPLFVPLVTKYYEQFKSGEKVVEYRLYGKRWNEWTCLVGRKATLSKGYGKADRLSAVVVGFQVINSADLSESVQQDIFDCFGVKDVNMSCIQFGKIKAIK